MCGIACLLSPRSDLRSNILERFTNAVAHRGPDGCGFMRFSQNLAPLPPTVVDGAFLGLGHRRLSILDLSEAGSQPMTSADGALAVVYNGEIYNFVELRKELEALGGQFNSHCDTEILLAAYQRWGKACLPRFNGMWSFVLLDKRKRTLLVSRDRIGVKPLYSYADGDVLAFASEIKQFFALPSFRRKANAAACVAYLVNGYENPPETFFEGVRAFPPGSCAEISLDHPSIEPERFWFPDAIKPTPREEGETLMAIRGAFSDAVRYRLRSDVPVGGCLSGGLDSSSIFVEMKRLEPTRTFAAFSACFDAPGIDERPFMRIVVDATQSDHHTVFPTPEGLAADFDGFLRTHDEPVGSLSMYAQYLIMREARRSGVPVLLDGQGGDELFSGYWPAYMLCLNYHRRRGDYGFLLRQLLGALSPAGNPTLFSEAWKNLHEYRKRASRHLPFEILDRHKDAVASQQWHLDAQSLSPADYRKAEIFKVHLPRLLKWEDRNSMAHSIESRVPFLDVNIVELALATPPEMNLRNGWNKNLLRKSMAANGLPKSICWRRDKKGFETPQDAWMRSGPFHTMLLDWTAAKEHPVSDYVSTRFDTLRSLLETRNFTAVPLFRLFCLDTWLRQVVHAP